MPEADAVINALQHGHDQLAPLVRAMTPEHLAGPSAASDWCVGQVLSHLGSGAVITLARLEAALTGEPAPGMDANRAIWAHWDAMTPEQQAAEFLDSNPLLLARYHGLDVATRDAVQVDMGFLPAPVNLATAARFRLQEFALHSWDVRVAADPEATVAPEAVPLLLDHVASMVGRIAKTAVLQGEPAHLAVTLTDPARTFGLRLGEAVELTEVPAEPDVELTAPAESWLRLATGRLAPRHTPDAVRIRGDFGLDILREVFPGY